MRPGHSLWISIWMTSLLCLGSGCTSKPSPPAPDLQSLHLQGLNLISQHRFEDAEKVLLALVEEAPEAFVPRFNLAIAQLNQAEKGVDRALVTLTTASTLNKASRWTSAKAGEAAVHYSLGIIHRFLGEEATALEEFRKALKQAPRDSDCHYQVAIGLMRSDKNEEALPHFEMAVQLDPTIRGAWNNLQLAWRRAGQIEDANRALATFQELESSGRGRAHSSKYTEQGKLAEAIRDWDNLPRPQRLIVPDFAEPVRITGPHEGGAPPFSLVDADLDCLADLWIAGDEPGSWDLTDKPKKIADLPALKGAICFAVGDVDEDGIPDIAVSDGEQIRVLRGEEGRTPAFKETISIIQAGAKDLVLADIDMEGDLDLLLADGIGPVKLALNEGKSFRSVEESPSLGGSQMVDQIIAVRDLDGDHDPDLLLAGKTLSWISGAPQWKFKENPQHRPLVAAGTIDVSKAMLADPPSMKEAEQLVILQDGLLRIWRPSATVKDAPGEALFAERVSLPAEIVSENYVAMANADFDLDGNKELVLGNSSETLIWHAHRPDFSGRRDHRYR